METNSPTHTHTHTRTDTHTLGIQEGYVLSSSGWTTNKFKEETNKERKKNFPQKREEQIYYSFQPWKWGERGKIISTENS